MADHRHQERVPRRLEVADHRHAVEAAIQQQQPGPDADARRLAEQALDHVLERLALAHAGQGHGEPLPVADDIGGGVGVEVAGAALGLAAVDLVDVAEGLAVVGDQGQVDGQPLEVRRRSALGRCPARAALSCRCNAA